MSWVMKGKRTNKWLAVIASVIIMATVSFVMMANRVIVSGPVQAQELRALYWGSYGSEVGLVQQKLRAWGYYDGSVDNYYGPGTWGAIKEFQRLNGLRVDGIVGPETWAALGVGGRAAPVAYQASSGISRSDEVGLLGRVVAAEAGNEPYNGQVAVAAVILNRVVNSAFPNTLSGVIYQPHAFESVSNGLVWRVSNLEAPMRAAQDALNGWDPSLGSIYFWNPSKPVTPWIWSRQIILTIGRHVFAR